MRLECKDLRKKLQESWGKWSCFRKNLRIKSINRRNWFKLLQSSTSIWCPSQKRRFLFMLTQRQRHFLIWSIRETYWSRRRKNKSLLTWFRRTVFSFLMIPPARKVNRCRKMIRNSLVPSRTLPIDCLIYLNFHKFNNFSLLYFKNST